MVKLNLPNKNVRVRCKRAAKRLGASKTSGICSVDLATAAVAYARQGWAVLPLHTIRDGRCSCSAGLECQSPGKHPLLKGGVHGASKDEDEIARLWREHPDANVGIATGKVSDLVVLDVDPRNGGRETTRRLIKSLGKFPHTVVSDTGGGGYHRIFRYPDTDLSTKHAHSGAAGIDLQSDGAYIVAPPSRHVSGRRYSWRAQRAPGARPLAGLPQSWISHFQMPKKSPSAAHKSASGGISEGGRNTFLASRAGALWKTGLSAEGLLAALKAENTARCTPPLDDDEVARIADSIGRYPAEMPVSGDEGELVMQAVLDQHYGGGTLLMRPSDGRFWAFDGARWVPLDKQVVASIVLAQIMAIPNRRGPSTSSLVRQVISLLEARVAADGDPLRFNAAPLPVINCRNGELWIDEKGHVELRPHTPSSFLCHVLDVDFDPEATCPRYDAAVSGIFGKAPDPAEMAKFWDELMGYTVQPDRRIPLVLLVWGSGNNGKTKLIQTLIRLLGRDLVVAMPIGDFEKSRFSIGNLLGKFALVDDDVRAGTRLPDGHLKRLSEEKTMTGEHKYGQPFTFTARAAIFMLFNNPPSLADLSHGMLRRLIVVPFDRKFEAEETDRGLFQDIWANELPGILNRYLAGLRRVIGRRWAFNPPADADRAKKALLRAAHPLPAFIDERCESGGSTYVQALYDAYNNWAQRAGITLSPQRLAFKRNLESLGFKAGHGNRGSKIYGLRLRPDTRA